MDSDVLFAYGLSKNYTDKAINNLDISGEVAEQLPAVVDDYLSEHIDPETGYVLDNSLTLENAAAQAKAVGDKIEEMKTPTYLVPTILNNVGITSQGYVRSYNARETAVYRLKKGERYIITNDTTFFLVLLSNTLYSGTDFTAEFIQTPSSRPLYYKNEVYDYLYLAKKAPSGTFNPTVKVDINGDIRDTEKEINDIAYIDFEKIETTIQHGKALNYGNGNIIDASGYVITDYIDIDGYSSVKVSGRSNYGNGIACFYDSSKAFISCPLKASSGSTNTTYTNEELAIPYNAKYIIIGGREGSSSAFTPVCMAKQEYKLKKWNGIKWLAFGDSLTDSRNTRATKRYFDYIKDATSISVINGGVSGSGFATDGEAALGENTNWRDRILTYENTDFDVITFFGSFNDLSSGLPTGTASDTTAETKAGCMNITFDNLFSIKPLAIVGVITPTPWETAYPGDTAADNYVNVLIEICRKRGIPVLDLYHESLLRPWDSTFRGLAYSRDEGHGVHPDETGHKMFAPRIEAFLDNLLLH